MYELLIKTKSYVGFLNKNFEKDVGSHFYRYTLSEYNEFGGWRTKRDNVKTDSKEKIKMLIDITGMTCKKKEKVNKSEWRLYYE